MDLAGVSFLPAYHLSGGIDPRPAEIIVMHSMECPAEDRRVTNWVRSLATPQGSRYFAHYYTGPGVTYRVAELGRTVPHVGGGNRVRGRWTLGVEQAGYARYSRQEWIDSGALNTAGPLVAALVAAGHGANRWLTPAELAQPGIRGVTSHNNMRVAFGGTSHTDPGDNYPHELLLAPTETPSPQPPSPPQLPSEEDDLMTAVTHPDGHHELFTVYAGGLVQNWQDPTDRERWSGWQTLDKTRTYKGPVSATVGPDGNVNVFAQVDGGYVALWFDHQSGRWSGPVPVG